MAKVRLNTANIKEYANKIVTILKDSEKPVTKAKLAEEIGLTEGQLSQVIKYMRRCAEMDLERFIPYYPISSKKGYSLPHEYKDFLPCFYTLYMWSKSLERTIEPMKQKMQKEGIDILEYANSKDNFEFCDNFLHDLEEINKHTSWFLEKEDN